MSNSARLAGLLALLVCFAAGQSQEPQPTTLAVGSATIDEIKGEVSIRAAQGVAAAAQRGQTVDAGNTIETGKGSVVLHLQDGSQVLVKSHSRVVVKAPEQSAGQYFELLLGKVLATVKKRLGSSPSFRMGTPTAVITVRGTRFEVHVSDKGKTYVEVYEGVVEVMGLGAPSAPVLLRPGYWTRVDTDQGPSRPQSRYEMENRELPGGRESERPEQGGAGGERGSQPQSEQPTNPTQAPQQTQEKESEPHSR